MQGTSFAVVMGMMATGGCQVYQNDEPAAVRKAICKAAGMSEDRAGEAVEHLKATDPKRLLSLLEKEGNISTQVSGCGSHSARAYLKSVGRVAQSVCYQVAILCVACGYSVIKNASDAFPVIPSKACYHTCSIAT